ncbi:MAG: translation initiation factor IF-6 [Candidatus Aenigmarchaeota archaeon]|nr:translation initiation factor IF-6 [Candidatus Aenigmarchaeota archaeon]
MAVYQTEFSGNPTLGLYGLVTDNVSYIPTEIPKRQVERISKALESEIKKAVFHNSSLLGLFGAANSKYLFVPEIISNAELKTIGKKIVKITGAFNTIGNLMLCNDKGCVLSPYLADKKYFLEKELKLKTGATTISDLPFPGALSCVTNKSGIVHMDCKDSELEILEKTLGVEFKRLEFYSGFPGAEILANSKGLLTPKTLKGPELAEIQEGLKLF